MNLLFTYVLKFFLGLLSTSVLIFSTSGALATTSLPSKSDLAREFNCRVALNSIDPLLTRLADFFANYESYLRQQLNDHRDSGPKYVIHEDSLACRFCSVSSSFLQSDLARHFPEVRWEVRRTKSTYQEFYHDYVYSKDIDLMVDATYRQFLVGTGIDDFDKLPPIFVGSPDAFRDLMQGKFPDDVIQKYLYKTSHIKKPYQFDRKSQFIWYDPDPAAADNQPPKRRKWLFFW